MPLPDERPRQSVANLIGRFEKRASIPAASPGSRPSSVVSHVTGDSQKVEAKEKREWPPASAPGNPPDTISPPETQNGRLSLSPLQERLEALSIKAEDVEQPSLSAPQEVPMLSTSPEPAAVATIVQDTPAPLETTPLAAPVSPEASPKKPQSSAKPINKPTMNKSTPRTQPAATRATPSKPVRTPAPSATSTPNKIATALKPQLTGTSATSSNATVRDRPRVGAKSPLATRAGAKTPTAVARPAASASTTASSSAAPRPKTPGSGLYAPTKASLARTKNAPDVPVPARKATINASSLDRLSKPTAASASKAKVPISSPPRGVTKAARGAPPSRGVVKPRLGLAGARMQAKPDKNGVTNIAKPESSVDIHTTDSSAGEAVSSQASEAVLSPGTESQENDDEVSDIESYDDAFASEGEGAERLSLDNVHVHGAEASFSFTPEHTPITATMAADNTESELADSEQTPIAEEEALENEAIETQEPQHENGHVEDPVDVKAEADPEPAEAEVIEETHEQPAPEEQSNEDEVAGEEKEHLIAPESFESEANSEGLHVPTDEKAARPNSVVGSETAGSIPDEDL